MRLHPYLLFNGTCEEAMTFYKDCFGGSFESIRRFKDGPPEMGGRKVSEAMMGKVMHMTWRFDDNVVMASDGLEKAPMASNVSLSVSMTDPDQLAIIFDKLRVGGRVTMAPQDTFWGARFAMLTDRYGTGWMLSCDLKQS